MEWLNDWEQGGAAALMRNWTRRADKEAKFPAVVSFPRLYSFLNLDLLLK
jgi:hypothetical protein